MNLRTVFRENSFSHILFWLGYFLFLWFVFSFRDHPESPVLLRALVLIVPQMLLVYANMEWMVPRWFMQKQYILYVLLTGALIVGAAFLIQWMDPWVPPWEQNPEIRNPFREKRPGGGLFKMLPTVLNTLSLVILSTAYKTSQVFQRKEKETTELKSEKLDAELKFLKSQINPHFLFNALNNVYALSVIKSDIAPEMILKLSEMLRYLLYDCSADRMPLAKEIAYINNYISLLKLKDSNIRNIEIDFEAAEGAVMIEPMLFIPFIENSFKHSKIEDIEKGWIHMSLKTHNGKLDFEIKNSIPEAFFTKDEVGGIGIDNVRRRLDLCYPDAHTLTLTREPTVFSVALTLKLS